MTIELDHVEDDQPVSGSCPECGAEKLRIKMRLRAAPVGSFSLAGAQVKFSASGWPYLVCGGCGIFTPAKQKG